MPTRSEVNIANACSRCGARCAQAGAMAASHREVARLRAEVAALKAAAKVAAPEGRARRMRCFGTRCRHARRDRPAYGPAAREAPSPPSLRQLLLAHRGIRRCFARSRAKKPAKQKRRNPEPLVARPAEDPSCSLIKIELTKAIDEVLTTQRKLAVALQTLREVDDVDFGVTAKEAAVHREDKLVVYRFQASARRLRRCSSSSSTRWSI